MAKPHLFSLNSDVVIEQNVRGQAAQVLAELRADTEPRLAVDIDARIAATNPFKTRQDTLRVTLYYLIVFAKRGWVIKDKPQANENAVAVEGEDVEDLDGEGDELRSTEQDATVDETDAQDANEYAEQLDGE